MAINLAMELFNVLYNFYLRLFILFYIVLNLYTSHTKLKSKMKVLKMKKLY